MRTLEETIERARQIRSAALAPADPSSQDRQVAAAASQMEGLARIALAASKREENAGAASLPIRNGTKPSWGAHLVSRSTRARSADWSIPLPERSLDRVSIHALKLANVPESPPGAP